MNISHSFLTLSRRRITPWRENPILISNMIVDTSDTSPTTSVITSIERKTPIREFLSMKKNNLSMILCFSPISWMEPWEPIEFLERRFDPLRPGPWRNMNAHNILPDWFYISHLDTLGIRIARRIRRVLEPHLLDRTMGPKWIPGTTLGSFTPSRSLGKYQRF